MQSGGHCQKHPFCLWLEKQKASRILNIKNIIFSLLLNAFHQKQVTCMATRKLRMGGLTRHARTGHEQFQGLIGPWIEESTSQCYWSCRLSSVQLKKKQTFICEMHQEIFLTLWSKNILMILLLNSVFIQNSVANNQLKSCWVPHVNVVLLVPC